MIETICLIVFGIIGSYCYEAPVDYEPPGTCIFNVCFVEQENLPVRASWYDPVLGGINCQEPCDTLGDGSPVDEWYGEAIACPPGWYGETIYFPQLDLTRQCRDSGGAIEPTCREVFDIHAGGRVFTCYIAVDFLEHEQPPWAYSLLEWEIKHDKTRRERKYQGENAPHLSRQPARLLNQGSRPVLPYH